MGWDSDERDNEWYKEGGERHTNSYKSEILRETGEIKKREKERERKAVIKLSMYSN